MLNLRQQFDAAVKWAEPEPQVLVVVVQLPSGVHETIVNYQDIPAKISYYQSAYDEEFRLRTNPAIKVVGCLIV